MIDILPENHGALLVTTFAGILPLSLTELRPHDSHTQPFFTEVNIGSFVETARVELRELKNLDIISSLDRVGTGLLVEEREIRRESGTTLTYSFKWSSKRYLVLSNLMEGTKWYGQNGKRQKYTLWGDDRYHTSGFPLRSPAPEELEWEEHEDLHSSEEEPESDDESDDHLEADFNGSGYSTFNTRDADLS